MKGQVRKKAFTTSPIGIAFVRAFYVEWTFALETVFVASISLDFTIAVIAF